MNRRAHRIVDAADALRRAHAALGEAVVGLRNVSLRGEEQSSNLHRIRLAEAQVFEARYHLGAARSILAVGLALPEAPEVPRPVLTIAQVVAARRAIRRLETLRAAVGKELRALAHRAGDPELARRLDELPAERVPRPLAEGLLYGGVGCTLIGVTALLAGWLAWAGGAVGMGLLGIAVGADGLRRRRDS